MAPHGKSADLEHGLNGDRSSSDVDPYADLDEYTALQKYISTYRDPRAAMFESEAARQNAADAGKGRPWWAFWRSGASSKAQTGDPGTVPEEWLNTTLDRGVSSADVESRRRQFGFNEITTEKENMFLKFLSYFQGPVLYGERSKPIDRG